jgi:hypothetical protein
MPRIMASPMTPEPMNERVAFVNNGSPPLIALACCIVNQSDA